MVKIKLGFAPTRRSIFSAPTAVEYANYIRENLKRMGLDLLILIIFQQMDFFMMIMTV